MIVGVPVPPGDYGTPPIHSLAQSVRDHRASRVVQLRSELRMAIRDGRPHAAARIADEILDLVRQ